MKIPRIEVTLTAEAPYRFNTEGGQTMNGKLPIGSRLNLPAAWVYETVTPLSGRVVAEKRK